MESELTAVLSGLQQQLRQLQQAVQTLRTELDALRQENQALRQALAQVRPAPSGSSAARAPRRQLVRVAAAGSAAAALGLLAARPAPAVAQGPLLSRHMQFDAPVDRWGNFPPLNSSVTWSRFHRQHTPGATDEILSLIHEAQGPAAFPWSLYIQLTSRTDPVGNAVGAYVRLFNEEDGWAAAFHTDEYHIGSGTTIGVNVELTRTDRASELPGGHYPPLPAQPAGRAIGLNILNTDHSAANGDQGINIQGGQGRSWDTAINVEDDNAGAEGLGLGGQWAHGVHLRGAGGTAITIDGDYAKGIDLHGHSLHVGTGGRIYLDDRSEVYITYNATTRHIEYVYAPVGVVAAIPLPPHGTAHP